MYQELADSCRTFFAEQQTDTRRIFHGRGQLHPGLEHLSVDWFSPVVLISSHADIAEPESLKHAILSADTDNQIQSIQLQFRKQKGTPTETLHGDSTKHCVVVEHSLRYEIQPGVNQNAGLFLDMAPLRRWLTDNTEQKNVLNLFSYTCSLSVAAMAGGARQAVNVDMSKPSINWGLRNHELNNQDLRSVRSIPHNLLRSWGRIQKFGLYDTIIIDPPTRQRGSFDAEKNYSAVIKKIKQLAAPGAEIIATVNSPYIGEDFLIHLFQRYAPQCRFIEMMPRAPEFTDKYPERALKIYRFRVS